MFSRHECRVFSCLPTCGRGLQRYRKNAFTWHTHQPPICCFSTTMHQPFSGWHALNAQVRQVSCHAVLPFSLNNQWLIISSLLFFRVTLGCQKPAFRKILCSMRTLFQDFQGKPLFRTLCLFVLVRTYSLYFILGAKQIMSRQKGTWKNN